MERTEEDALESVLRFTIGGEPVELHVLTIAESDEWLARLATALAGVELPTEAGVTAALWTAPHRAVVDIVAAYDRDGVLGGPECIRDRASKRELKAALDAMVTAEDPFEVEAARSVAEAFGAPSRDLRLGMRLAFEPTIARRLGSSMAGLMSATDSAGPASGGPGPASSSSSAGGTTRTASGGRRRKGP